MDKGTDATADTLLELLELEGEAEEHFRRMLKVTPDEVILHIH